MSNRKQVLITGGSSGIGLALAEQWCAQGWDVALMARDSSRLEAAKSRLLELRSDSAQQIRSYSVDVGDRKAVAGAVQALIAAAGAPDMVVLSAGVAVPGYFAEIDDEVFEQTMRVNYFGSLYMARALLPHMSGQGGVMLFISSGAALTGVFGYSAYSPSKFAVRGLAEVLRAELRPQGIQVSIAYPPDTDTPQYEFENRTKPVETRAITASAGLWQADDVAAEIIKGIEKRRFVIAIGTELKLLARLQSLIAPLLNWWFDRAVARVGRSGS